MILALYAARLRRPKRQTRDLNAVRIWRREKFNSAKFFKNAAGVREIKRSRRDAVRRTFPARSEPAFQGAWNLKF